MKQMNWKILLLLDNFCGHKWHEDKITSIKVLFFSPNLMPFVQPADASIIHCLEAIFHKLMLYCLLDHKDAKKKTSSPLISLRPCSCWRRCGRVSSSQQLLTAGDTQEFFHQVMKRHLVVETRLLSLRSRLRFKRQPIPYNN